MSDPLLSYPILNNGTSVGGSWGKAAEEKSIVGKEVKSECQELYLPTLRI